MTKTQKYNIADQLNAGLRYFNIRVDYDYDEIINTETGRFRYHDISSTQVQGGGLTVYDDYANV